jgi:hypothetical protein
MMARPMIPETPGMTPRIMPKVRPAIQNNAMSQLRSISKLKMSASVSMITILVFNSIGLKENSLWELNIEKGYKEKVKHS